MRSFNWQSLSFVCWCKCEPKQENSECRRPKISRDKINQKYLWHQRLGHIREDRINRLEKDGIFGSLNPEPYLACESCLQEKMVKLPFVGYGERATELLALVHTDVSGLFDVGGVVILTSLSLSMICLGTDMYISWNINLRPLKSSRNSSIK